VQRELVAKRLDEISPHWFRHSGASIAINSGAMSLDNASKMLGHSSPTITAEMYYHPDEAQIEEGMQQLGAKAFG
jgi:integrase